MLSATLTSYDLHKCSGIIANEINYTKYIINLQPYDIHPFQNFFVEKIKPLSDKLKKTVEGLQKTHKTLKEAVLSTYSNPNNLFQTIETIECDIQNIYKCLKCYVEDELPKLNKQLNEQIQKFEQQLKCSCGKLSSEILIVKKTLSVTTKITYIVKTTIETMSKIQDGSTYEIKQVIKEITENFEKTKESRIIENKLRRICDSLKELLPTPKFPDPNCLTYEDLEKYNQQLQAIQDWLKELECVIRYIKCQRKRFQDIIEKNTRNTTTTQRSGGKLEKYLLKEQKGDLQTKSMEFQLSYQTEVTKIQKLVSVRHTINGLLTDVCSEIDKLDEQVKPFKEHLKNVKGELERLNYIKFLNEQLKALERQLDLIKCYALNLKSGPEESPDDIVKRLKKFNSIKQYYICIDLIRRTVDSLLDKTEIKNACSCNPHLVSANAALECVKNKLCKLESIGKSIPDLIEIAPIITELVGLLDRVGIVLCTLENELEDLGEQQETTSQKLEIINTFRDTVDNAIRTIGGYIDGIKGIGEARTTITEQYNSYTAEFEEFNKALKELETCLDYFIGNFLTCSLCTTICNLKGQLRDTTWECPDTECKSCLGSAVMTEKVLVLQGSLHRYSRLVFGHFSTLDTKVFISKLYRFILRVDDIVRIVQVVDCCCCVKKLQGNDKAHNTDQGVNSDTTNNSGNSNSGTHRMMTYRQYVNHIKTKDETQLKAATLDTLSDTDNTNHLCLCLAIRYRLYPCLLKTVTLLVQLELQVSGNIARKFGTQSVFNSYYKLSGCNSYRLSLSTMLVLSTWAMIKLASYLEYRYKIEHDNVKCCTKDEHKCKCECNKTTDSSSGSSSIKCCQCCVCPNGTGSPSTPTPTSTPCCCGKGEGSNRCGKAGCKNDNNKPCCCKCCCYCVCESKIDCKCKCDPEEHCFCSKHYKYYDDCYYRWFIYVILYICHLVESVFTMSYWDIQKAMQCLSNLLSRLDAVCWESDRRCVTVSDKPSGEGAIGGTTQVEASPAVPSPKPLSPAPIAPSPQQQTPKVRCCLVCVNVKVVCVSFRLVCNVHKYFVKCKEDKKEECNTDKIECICKCESAEKCLDQLTNLTNLKDKLNCELFSGLKEKLKSVNTPPPKWNIVCECKADKCECLCKDPSDKLKEVCTKLKVELSKVKIEDFKCGCESVVKCCCCCKCDECGTGKSRKCNEKGCGHANGQHNGDGGATQGSSTGSTAANSGDNECPCIKEGEKDSVKCCCNNKGKDGKSKGCNCTKDKPGAKPPGNCECCCLSCCADKEEDEKKEGEKKEGDKKEGEKNCPCKKKKKKEKKKVHCKDDDNLKDKRCCCKCRPEENGTSNGGGTPPSTSNGATATATPAPSPTNNPEKECCCCCQCKTKCGAPGGASAAGGGNGGGAGGTSNGNGASGTPGTSGGAVSSNCNCQNGKDKKDEKCKCYCCFVCDHGKSALKSVCKQLAYELKSSISVLSKLASNFSIECCESDNSKLTQTLTTYLEHCNQKYPKTCLTATRTGRGCDISHVMVGGKTSLGGGNSGANPNIGDTNVTLTVRVVTLRGSASVRDSVSVIGSVSPSVNSRATASVRAVIVTTLYLSL